MLFDVETDDILQVLCCLKILSVRQRALSSRVLLFCLFFNCMIYFLDETKLEQG